MGHRVLVAGMADAQPDPTIGLAQMAVDRAQSVVPGMAATLLQPAFSGGQVQLVMEDHDIVRRQLPEIDRRPDRLARQVHEGLGLQEHHLLGPQPALADQPLMRALPRPEAMVGGDPLHRHEADVVAVGRIFRARIA